MRSFKVLSLLLSYPTEELKEAVRDFPGLLAAEAIVPAREQRALAPLIEEIADGDLLDAQERYVLLFDRTRSLSLHLFEHVHGESRDRGQAMIDLKSLYEAEGLVIAASELPDYLPLFLEFLSTRSLPQACDLLGQPAHILAALAERLDRRGSAYAAVFRALVAVAAHKPGAEEVATLVASPDPDPQDLAALDATWEDEPVTFGPGAAGGCRDGLVARLRAAKRPASGANA
ncbi:nitrate reductase molybdenum cofactor assembly chaperone [Chelatococcus sp. SYSU_G07232]|uniref:Nitrate reductase molybdenum cofactor assembly chaperone n=1 Tax=Chelatococcus albus TaxID=3047466 RepID=A0ABT7AMZ4_9HYPH|nr:nitrate reductase molybdenum cofactor assembly chaperone [Chelatococcus sp. SYSU_G07232]MDJ1159926.1 nitrate reductase molybdenum cofactor assembly chaperone [Chelatococcus sp. SYSU_G07232]